MKSHEYFMQKALMEAARADHNLSPNPKVGCVIVKNGEIIASGYHRGPGHVHAEVDALNKVGRAAHGTDLYVTLEPCCHFGRTSPCTDAIISAGIKRVFFTISDPNPKVSGKSSELLRTAGIEVTEDICSEEAHYINRFFIYFMKYHKPYVIAKWAMSLDGKMVTNSKTSKQISSSESQLDLHHTRNNIDAILVGVNTIINDDPLLTTRLPESITISHPHRIILDTHGRTPLDSQILSGNLPGKTIIATTELSKKSWRSAVKNAEIWILPTVNQRVSIPHLLQKMAEYQIMSVLVEGGRTVLESFFSENVVQETQVYLAPHIIGSSAAKKSFKWFKEKTLGDNKLFQLML